MPDLHLIGVHEDGRHLVLASREGEEFALPLDDRLRSVLRRHDGAAPTSAGRSPRAAGLEPLRPTEVQAMIRAGADADEAAERAGWSVEKVHRYEGPILAERAHIAELAGRSHVRDRSAGSGHPTTLVDRVQVRLLERGVDVEAVEWDAWRSEDGQWTVDVRFAAEGRRRTASWHFSRSAMTVEPVDDEARRLSDDAEAPAPPRARGGDFAAPPGQPATATSRIEPGARRDDDADLVTSMRERSAARARRRPTRRVVEHLDHASNVSLPMPLPTTSDLVAEPAHPQLSAPDSVDIERPSVDIERPADGLTTRDGADRHDLDAASSAGEHTDPHEDLLVTVTVDGSHRRVTTPVVHTDPVTIAGSPDYEAEPAHSPTPPSESTLTAPAHRDRSVASDTVDEPELPLLEEASTTTRDVDAGGDGAEGIGARKAGDGEASHTDAANEGEEPNRRASAPVTTPPPAPAALSVSADDRPAVSPAEPVQPNAPAPTTESRPARAARRSRGKARPSIPAAATPDVERQPPRLEPSRSGDAGQDDSAAEQAPTRPTPAPRRRPKGRASVPAWDDIMFGAKHPADD